MHRSLLPTFKSSAFAKALLIFGCLLAPPALASDEGPTWDYFYRALDNGGRDKTILESARVFTKAETAFRISCLRRFKPPSFWVRVKDKKVPGTPLAIRLTKDGEASIISVGRMRSALDQNQQFIDPADFDAFMAADTVEIGTYKSLGWERISGPEMKESILQLKCLKYLEPKGN